MPATTQNSEPQKEQPETEIPLHQMSTRDRLLKYMAEGPHLTHEEGEELRKMLREAREENFVRDLSA